MEPSTIALIIIGIVLILYITEIIPIATTSIVACLALAIFDVIPINTAFSGFGNDMVFLMAGMIVVGNSLFETGAAQKLGEKIISLVGGNERVFTIVLIVVSLFPAAFLSNTAAAAMMLPVAASAINASGGKFSKKNSFMFIGIAAVTSGGLTTVGSTPQVIAQNMLIYGGHETMRFFELSRAGGPIIVLLIAFYLIIGHTLQKRVFIFPEPIDNTSYSSPPIEDNSKMWISIGILIFCIIGFISGIWSLGIVAMVGAVACIVTKCISQKTAFAKMDWTTIIVIAASLGLSAGLDQSGAGSLIAQNVVHLLGENVSPWLLVSVLALVTVILGNFMSSTATAALLVPIAISVAIETNVDVKSVVMAVVIAANISYATPISTPAMTMTLPAGYRFTDYIKVGGLFTVLAYLLIVALFPFILNF